MLIDLLCLAVMIWVAIRVTAEGAWGSVIVFLTVGMAGLFAMNLFEPVAELLDQKISDGEAWRFRWDFLSLIGSFTLAVFVLRGITDRLAPASMPLPWLFETVIRWTAGVATGYLMMAFLLTAWHTAPLPRNVSGTEVTEPLGFEPERKMVFGLAPDRQWLAFNQWLSEHALNRGSQNRIFDGPIYHLAGDRGFWPSFPLRYADRRERMTQSRQ
ncbi:MAG: CvpA family protein [Planctomycetaceae bacterium]|nr:CvpA family protein [Planctomycetaceae bacterium]